MNLSLLGKIGIILKYIFSSFLSIEMFIMCLLLFFILLLNLKKSNYVFQLIAVAIYVGFIIGVFLSYTTYVKTCIDSFIKEVMSYIYFPSTIVYFFIMIFVVSMTLYTLFSKKLSFLKKVINYSVFSILYFFFMSFLSLAAYSSVDLLDLKKLYQSDILLSLVQVSNFILLLWIIYTGFYHLYLYFKKRFD